MKLLFKMKLPLAIFVLLLSGSKCLERSEDDAEDTPFAGIIQNEMKSSEMQDTDNQNTDKDNADADDAQKAGEDVMEFSDAGLEEQDEDDDLGDASEDPKSSGLKRRRHYDRRRRLPGRRRRGWAGWGK